MAKLSQENFRRARQYIMDNGRQLDQALFSYYFEGGQGQAVIEALAGYQNPDGGFGRALEPDIRAAASSAVATQVGFEYLHSIGAGAEEFIVTRAIRYLLHSFDSNSGVWPIVPPEIESAPHAPWWDVQASSENFNGFVANPRAALVGYLHLYRPLVPVEFLDNVTGLQLDHLASLSGQTPGMHEFLCYLSLAENLPAREQAWVANTLTGFVPLLVEKDPGKWSTYGLRPLAVTPAPDSLLAAVIDRAAIDANLDYEIETQLEDGSWPLTWSWDFIDEEAWRAAERDWKGYHAVKMLKRLQAYGRLA